MKTALKKVMKQSALSIKPIGDLYRKNNQIQAELATLALENQSLNHRVIALEGMRAEKIKVDFALGDAPTANPVPPILEDSFIHWIKNAVSGWCTDLNIKVLDECVKYLKDGAVIEIGSFCGLSTSILAHALRRHAKKNTLYSVDNWFFEGHEQCTGTISGAFTASDWMEHTEASFKLAVKLCAKNINHSHVKLNSDEFFAKWHEQASIQDLNGNTVTLGGDIAFAYIDGDHSYEQTKKDFMNVDAHLVKGGFVFFDDSAENVSFGSKDVAKEVMAMPNYRLVSPDIETANRCFIKL